MVPVLVMATFTDPLEAEASGKCVLRDHSPKLHKFFAIMANFNILVQVLIY